MLYYNKNITQLNFVSIVSLPIKILLYQSYNNNIKYTYVYHTY